LSLAQCLLELARDLPLSQRTIMAKGKDIKVTLPKAEQSKRRSIE
jgi:hypothetical protein